MSFYHAPHDPSQELRTEYSGRASCRSQPSVFRHLISSCCHFLRLIPRRRARRFGPDCCGWAFLFCRVADVQPSFLRDRPMTPWRLCASLRGTRSHPGGRWLHFLFLLLVELSAARVCRVVITSRSCLPWAPVLVLALGTVGTGAQRGRVLSASRHRPACRELLPPLLRLPVLAPVWSPSTEATAESCRPYKYLWLGTFLPPSTSIFDAAMACLRRISMRSEMAGRITIANSHQCPLISAVGHWVFSAGGRPSYVR